MPLPSLKGYHEVGRLSNIRWEACAWSFNSFSRRDARFDGRFSKNTSEKIPHCAPLRDMAVRSPHGVPWGMNIKEMEFTQCRVFLAVNPSPRNM
jgi:hypothetical protein